MQGTFRDRGLTWWHSDKGATPASPWAQLGSGTATVGDDGLDVNDNTSSQFGYQVNAVNEDSGRSSARPGARLEIQAQVEGTSFSSGWSSGLSGICLWLDDGERRLAVSIGDTLALVDPSDGTELWEVATGHPWTTRQSYRLIKFGTGRWVLQLDGRTVATIPYRLSGASPGAPALGGFGSLDSSGSARAVFQMVEMGCNTTLPPNWKVLRYFNALPAPIQARWTEVGRAWLRTVVGMVAQSTQLLREFWQESTSDRWSVDEQVFQFDGSVLPTAVTPAWTTSGSGPWVVVRSRVRHSGGGGAVEEVIATFSTLPSTVPDDLTVRFGLDLVVRAYSVGPNGRIGPYLSIAHHGRAIHVQMYETAADDRAVWAFTDAAFTGAVAPVDNATEWALDPTVEHRVEVWVCGQSTVLLLIDGTIVDRQPFTRFPATGSGDRCAVGVYGQPGPSPFCNYEMSNAIAERTFSDEHRRDLFEQQVLERLIVTSGCDRNDELEVWSRHHHEMQAMRGTSIGILLEMRRISCEHDDVWLTRDATPGGWYLEQSYPEVTPVYLEQDGDFVDVYLEFTHSGPQLTTAEVAAYAARYLVPASVEELQYYVCAAARLTAAAAAGGPGLTRLTVTQSGDFKAGDQVTLRDPTNTNKANTVVDTVVDDTTIDVAEIAGLSPYATDSVLRKTLHTT